MKKRDRIKSGLEFEKIITGKKRRNTGSFTLYIQERRNERSRYGISVPKKLGNAVLRNKVKRQVRSMLQTIGYFEGDFDGIIIVRKKYFEKTFIENQKDLENLLKTVKI